MDFLKAKWPFHGTLANGIHVEPDQMPQIKFCTVDLPNVLLKFSTHQPLNSK